MGDEVFGFAGFRIGANAEYMRLGEAASLCIKPTNTSFEEAAAAVDGASTALFFLRDKARIRPGDRVLIVGASGSIGSYAVQLAAPFRGGRNRCVQHQERRIRRVVGGSSG